MARLGYCIPCGEGRRDVDATVMVGDDPMCAMHALEHGDGMLTQLPEPVPLTEAIAAVAEAQAEPVAAPLCSRGCGKRSHRGRCRGLAQPKPLATLRKYRTDRIGEIVTSIAPLPDLPPLPALAAAKDDKISGTQGRDMGKLVAEEVDLASVPKVNVNTGRIGALFARWRELGEDKALKVACRDRVHLGTTRRGLEAKVKAAGLAVGFRSVGAELWCWKEAP